MGVRGRFSQSAPYGSETAAQQKHLRPQVLELCTERIISALQLLRAAPPEGWAASRSSSLHPIPKSAAGSGHQRACTELV